MLGYLSGDCGLEGMVLDVGSWLEESGDKTVHEGSVMHISSVRSHVQKHRRGTSRAYKCCLEGQKIVKNAQCVCRERRSKTEFIPYIGRKMV